MEYTELKEGLLKVAAELRSISETLNEQADRQQEKTASFNGQDLALGKIGGMHQSTDPLTEFCLS